MFLGTKYISVICPQNNDNNSNNNSNNNNNNSNNNNNITHMCEKIKGRVRGI